MSTADVITLTCPGCHKVLKVKGEMAGQQLHCPKEGCGATILVPGKAIAPGLGLRAQVMMVVGLVFALIAGALTVKQMDLAPGWLLSVALVAAVLVAEVLKGPFKSGALCVFTLVGLSSPALYFILGRYGAQVDSLPFYIGTVLFFVFSSYQVIRTYHIWNQFELMNSKKLINSVQSIIVWFSLIVSSLAFLWSTYYKYLTPFGESELLVRRLVFTFFFVVVGVLCSVLGRNRILPFLGVTGLIYMAAGVIKALVYDISHTEGWIRIGVFASSGVVLLLGGFLMMKKAPGPVTAAASASAFVDDGSEEPLELF